MCVCVGGGIFRNHFYSSSSPFLAKSMRSLVWSELKNINPQEQKQAIKHTGALNLLICFVGA